MRLGVAAIGLVAPGMDDWAAARKILRKENAYQPGADLNLKTLVLLPANERRRTTRVIKLALQSAQDALADRDVDKVNLATVFSSADGDLDVVDKIITALGMEGSPVSPTQFHNSVHNAPAGYWSIATKSHAPSTSLSAYDDSFTVGLLEAATQIFSDQHDVFLVIYDMPPPAVFNPFRPLHAAFATTLHLTNAEKAGLHSIIDIELMQDDRGLNRMAEPELEKLRIGNAAARALPLLESLANEKSTDVILPYLSAGALKIRVSPC